MVPSFYDKERTTSGEAAAFEALRGLNSQYVVLHGLGIAEHATQARGEADFVVIGPEGLLCLEVKGGRVTHQDGVWRITDGQHRSYTSRKSPWEQAADNAMSIRRRLMDCAAAPLLAQCVYASGVIFTDARVVPGQLNDSAVVMDIMLAGRRELVGVAGFVSRCYDYWRRKVDASGQPARFLSSADVEAALKCLRGDFDFVPLLDMWMARGEQMIGRATEEEKERYLEQVDEHRRILVVGGAGTGKTVISREYARRRAAQGDRVLFTCFNRNLCESLQVQAGGTGVRYASFLDYLQEELERMGRPVAVPPDSAPQVERDRFYDRELPAAFCAAMLATGAEPPFDCLVVDEGQDLIAPLYLRCMDAMVVGGLRDGRWHMCYDPEQNIYNTEDFAAGLAQLSSQTAFWDYRLVVNCRNTRAIAAYDAAATGTKVPRIAKVEGPRVEAVAYQDETEERGLLARLLGTLLTTQGVRANEICLLAPTSRRNTCLRDGLPPLPGGVVVTDLARPSRSALTDNTIQFCTVQGFKGLEAPVVILFEVEQLDRHALLHIALSRAKLALFVLYHAKLNEEHACLEERYESALPEGTPHLGIAPKAESPAPGGKAARPRGSEQDAAKIPPAQSPGKAARDLPLRATIGELLNAQAGGRRDA